MPHVAIVVPGIMGSQLELNGEVIWPGSLLNLIGSYKKMEELMDPDLKATDVIRSFSISKQYQGLLDDLGRCGFRESDQPATLFVCAYDWRRDNAESANTLADLVDKAAAAHGGVGKCEISLIAHSMGGLVSRYYLESGKYTQCAGFSSVRRLLTLGTPHRGSPLALTTAMGMEKRLFLSKEQVHRMVSDKGFPALYQLLPPPGEPFAWNEDKASAFESIDIYDSTVSQALGLAPDNLKAARDFHSALDMSKRPLFQGKPMRYFFFAGTRQTTVSGVTLLSLGPGKYRVRKMELEDAGDGTVPIWSAQSTGMQGQPVGGEHSTIYRNDVLRRTMGVLLGKAGVLAAAPADAVEVALRERVVNPNDIVHVALTFGAVVDKLNGHVNVQRVKIDASGAIDLLPPVASYAVNYAGLSAERLSVVFNAPSIPAIYKVVYLPNASTTPAGSDELFVQEAA